MADQVTIPDATVEETEAEVSGLGLDTLGAQIDALHSLEATCTGAIALRVAAAKAKCAHGEWLSWVHAHLPFGVSTAQRYLKVAKAVVANAARVQHLSLREALRQIADAEKQAEVEEEQAHQAANNETRAVLDAADEEADDPADLGKIDASEGEPTPVVEVDAARKLAGIVGRFDAVGAIVGAALHEVSELACASEGSEAAKLREIEGSLEDMLDQLREFVRLAGGFA